MRYVVEVAVEVVELDIRGGSGRRRWSVEVVGVRGLCSRLLIRSN